MKKRNVFLTAAIAAGLMMSALAMSVSAAQITEEDAKAIALENAGVKDEDVAYIYAKPDKEDRQVVFDVKFNTKTNEEYEYEILADTGKILEIDYEREFFSNTTGNAGKETTLEQAQETALSHAGTTADKVTFVKRETDYDDGRLVYELEFYTDTYQKYEYDIDAKNGQIIAWSYEAADASLR